MSFKMVFPYVIRRLLEILSPIKISYVPMNVKISGTLSRDETESNHRFYAAFGSGFRVSGTFSAWVDPSYGRQIQITSLEVRERVVNGLYPEYRVTTLNSTESFYDFVKYIKWANLEPHCAECACERPKDEYHSWWCNQDVGFHVAVHLDGDEIIDAWFPEEDAALRVLAGYESEYGQTGYRSGHRFGLWARTKV